GPLSPGLSGARRRQMARAHRRLLPRRRSRDDVEAGDDHSVETGREAVLMQTTFKVSRYDSEAGGKPTFQSYALELAEDATVLDGLFKIREELDGTLAFRASCNRGFCGECTLRINRGGRLACMTRVATTRTKEGEVTVEPTRYVRVLKDLVYDVDRQLWQKIKAVEPWLQPAAARPNGEYVVPDAELRPIR